MNKMNISTITLVKKFDSKVHESYWQYLRNSIRDLRVYRFAMYNFVVTNLRMRYRRSVMGFLWSLLNPLLVMTVLSVVFSLVFQRDIRTFAVYIFSGLSPWLFMSQAIQNGAQSLVLAEGFLKKVYLPKVMFPAISVTTEAINFLFSLLSLYIIALVLGSPLSWRLVLLPLAVIISFFFVLGCVITLSVATVYFRDLIQITTVVFTALFYTIPIVYPVETIPARFQVFFKVNPFYYFIALFRKVIYAQEPMGWLDWGIPVLIAVFTCAIGMWFLMKRDRDMIYRL